MAGLKTRGMCTGTLVAPDLVLTAAHCLFRANGQPARAEDVHFVAGWRGGNYVAHRVGAEVQVHPDFDSAQAPRVAAVPHDVGFLKLESAIPAETVAPLPLADLPETVRRVTLIGYRRDRPHAPSRQEDCRVTYRAPGRIGLDCPVLQGASGGPVLWQSPGGWRVVGLVSAAVTGAPPSRALAATIPRGSLLDPPAR